MYDFKIEDVYEHFSNDKEMFDCKKAFLSSKLFLYFL